MIIAVQICGALPMKIALLVLLVPMSKVRPMLLAMLTGGALAVLLRGMPLRLGVMVAIVAGIAAGFAGERWQARRAGT